MPRNGSRPVKSTAGRLVLVALNMGGLWVIISVEIFIAFVFDVEKPLAQVWKDCCKYLGPFLEDRLSSAC